MYVTNIITYVTYNCAFQVVMCIPLVVHEVILGLLFFFNNSNMLMELLKLF